MAASISFLYDLRSEISDVLTVDQITSTIIFGSNGIDGVYNPEVVYVEGDIVEYLDDDGVIHIYECVKTGATGSPINLDDWIEYSLMSALDAVRQNLIVLSATRPPDEYHNKVWIIAKSSEDGSIDPGDDSKGLIVTKNFIISATEPTPFTTDLVWGQVTSGPATI